MLCIYSPRLKTKYKETKNTDLLFCKAKYTTDKWGSVKITCLLDWEFCVAYELIIMSTVMVFIMVHEKFAAYVLKFTRNAF